jgi:hypothetical protein
MKSVVVNSAGAESSVCMLGFGSESSGTFQYLLSNVTCHIRLDFASSGQKGIVRCSKSKHIRGAS